jgi:hypothetical protein
VRAYLTTCDERTEVCAQTVGDLAQTDWGSPPTLVRDRSAASSKLDRIVDTGRHLLARAVEEASADDEVFLFCEDDVTFNRFLRHNLERWAPIRERRSDGHLFGSLYNPGIVPPSDDPATAVVIDPRHFYGTQGMVMTVTTARSLLEQWDDWPGALDVRVSRLAARWSPIWFHRPSLVQHRDVASTWGGTAHCAVDFSPDWRV